MPIASRLWLSSLALLCTSLAALPADLAAAESAKPADNWPAGVPALDDQGNPLNLDFETGDLRDWTAEGTAFDGQPIKGDTVVGRRRDMTSGHRGNYWIGTYEKHGDPPHGSLTSKPFPVKHGWASFLVGGGNGVQTRVDLIDAETGDVILRASGNQHERLQPVIVDLREHQGKALFLRLTDEGSEGWGHINFDGFLFHDSRPTFPVDVPRVVNNGLPANEAPAAMTLPNGFKATLFAAEPDVKQPIAMTIDDRGRLWVAEGYSYPIKRPAKEAADRILIFEDTDNDGHFDSRKVFIDKLNLVSGIEVGFGGVWVGQAPELLFIPDADGDDVPDGKPQVLLDGWHYEDTHETLNSFIWGPDGWLYGCHGVFTHSLVGKPGTPADQRIPINAGIWRYHPTKHQFEVFAHGTSNPWGVDFDDRGQCFLTCCVIPHLFHVIPGARYFRQAGQHFNPYTYDDIKTIAHHRHWAGDQWNNADRAASDALGGGHAHAGAMIYLGDRWPKEYRGRLFMNNIHGDRLNQDRLSPRGSGFEGNFAPDFLFANDAASQMLYMRYGPDGNVYVIDWYDTNECHRRDIEVHDRSNGRIFKISYEKETTVPQKEFKLPPGADLADLPSEQLVLLQMHSNDWYVRHARRILQERGAEEAVQRQLERLAFEQNDETRRLRGLWALYVTGGVSEGTLLKALEDESPYVRSWAVTLASQFASPTFENGKLTAKLQAEFERLAKADPSPVVRLALASAAGRLPLADRWNLIAGLLTHSSDATDHNLPLMYWYATEPLAAADMGRALALVTDSQVPIVRKYTLRRIADLGTEEAVGFLVVALGKADAADRQREFLSAINEALKGRKTFPMPNAWSAVYATLLTARDPGLASQADALAVTFGDSTARDKMRAALTDTAAPAVLRKVAIASLLATRDPKLATALQGLVTDREVSGEAIRALAAYGDPKTAPTLLDAYPALSETAKRDALTTLASRPEWAKELLSAIEVGKIPRIDLSADVVRQIRNLKDKSLEETLKEVWGVVRDTPEAKKKLIADYKGILNRAQPVPDLQLGRAIYKKTCAQCHKLFGEGGEVGPELTGSNRADDEYLLSNVVDPSAVMAKDYQQSIIVTIDGRVVTGIIKRETAEAVTVATPNETVIIPRSDIDEMRQTETSMMPDDLWKPLDRHQIRSLRAYLASPNQVPLPADDAAVNFQGDARFQGDAGANTLFNGKDLTGWKGDESLWKVENGEIVGTSPGIKHNAFLVHEGTFGDFDLTLEVKLVPNSGNSGIQFRSEPLPSGEMRGFQADIGAGWWGKLYEESGRGLMWKQSGEAHVKEGEWNTYRIRAEGDHVQTWINGQPCVDLTDAKAAKTGRIALQIHSGGPMTVRFRNFRFSTDLTAAR